MPVDVEFTLIQVVATVEVLPQSHRQVEVLSRTRLVVAGIARVSHGSDCSNAGFRVGDCDLLSAMV